MTNEQRVLESISRQMDTLPGHLGFYYKNLVTGYQFGIRAEETFLAASVIKLPLYLHILTQIAAGKIDPGHRLTIEDRDKMPSCGALSLFTGAVDTDIRTLCRLMIALSDNTAANALIRYCTIPEVNAGFRAMGLEKTCLRRLLFDAEASAAGLENTISPREMGMLLESLYCNRFVSPEVCQEALDTLLRQQIRHKLNGKLCKAVPIAHKTGEDDRLSNDVGIVFAPQPFVICFTGHDTDVYRWEDLMRRGTYDLYQAQKGNAL